MAGKFADTLAEAAYTIAGHGFAADEFGTVQDIGWNAIVDVTFNGMLNLDMDTDLISRTLYEHPCVRSGGLLVWIKENTEGFVNVVSYGSDEGAVSGSDMVNRQFDAAAAKASEDHGDW